MILERDRPAVESQSNFSCTERNRNAHCIAKLETSYRVGLGGNRTLGRSFAGATRHQSQPILAEPET